MPPEGRQLTVVAIATDHARIDDRSGGVGVEEDVVERRIVVDGEAAADHNPMPEGRVIGKSDARFEVLVVFRNVEGRSSG